MINEQYKYSDLTSKIIGFAMYVHKALGNAYDYQATVFELV